MESILTLAFFLIIIIAFLKHKSDGGYPDPKQKQVTERFNTISDLENSVEYFDKRKDSCKFVDTDHLWNYIFPILQDEPVGKDEFEKKECENNINRIQEYIQSTPIIITELVNVNVNYNFDGGYFDITIKINESRSSFRNFYYSIITDDKIYASGDNINFRFFVEDIDDAKKWKRAINIPSQPIARLMIVPKYITVSRIICAGAIYRFHFTLLGLKLPFTINSNIPN